MNIDNIRKILASKIYKRICRLKGYRGYTVVDTQKWPPRSEGYFFYITFFFESDKKIENALETFRKEFQKIIIGESCHFSKIELGYGKMVAWMVD